MWSDHADFDKKLKDFQAHAADPAEVNAKEKGATDAFKAAVAALAQDCKGCHDTYKRNSLAEFMVAAPSPLPLPKHPSP